MIETLLFTDVETTGLDATKDACIEVAIAAWSVHHHTMIGCYSTLIECGGNAAESINRIPADVLLRAKPKETAWRAIYAVADGAATWGDAAFVAHRAEFDRSFYLQGVADRWPWICSKFDFEFPRSKPGASLVEVALAHDVAIAVNHRALADVLLLCRIFERCGELGCDVSAMIEKAMRPKKTYQAVVSFDDREKAKAAGFSWDGKTKLWTKRIAVDDIPSLALDFEVREVACKSPKPTSST